MPPLPSLTKDKLFNLNNLKALIARKTAELDDLNIKMKDLEDEIRESRLKVISIRGKVYSCEYNKTDRTYKILTQPQQHYMPPIAYNLLTDRGSIIDCVFSYNKKINKISGPLEWYYNQSGQLSNDQFEIYFEYNHKTLSLTPFKFVVKVGGDPP